MPNGIILLAELRAAGFVVRLDGARFWVEPGSRTTPELRERIALGRDEILAALRAESERWPDPPPDGTGPVAVQRLDGSWVGLSGAECEGWLRRDLAPVPPPAPSARTVSRPAVNGSAKLFDRG